LHPKNKSKVTDGSSNQKRAYKNNGLIFSKSISSLSFYGTTMLCKSGFKFTKIKKFQLFSYEIFLNSSGSAFLAM
jgi:hypothetical protein